MESQIAHSADHDREQNRQSVGTTHLGEEEDHPEKKSMLTKVKDKAKKITKSLKGHGQGQEHDQDDGEGDDDNEDPELHSPTTTSSGTPGQGDIHKVPLRKFGDTSAAKRDDDPSAPIERPDLKVGEPINTRQADPARPGPRGHEEISGQQRGDLGRRTNVTGEGGRSPLNTPVPSFGEHNKSKVSDEGGLGQTGLDENSRVHKADVSGNEGLFGQPRPANSPGSLGEYKSKTSDPSHASVTGKEGRSGQPGVTLDRPRGEDLHSSKARPQASNYETKAPDPAHAGGEESGVTPIVHSLEKMDINSGSEHNQDRNPVSNSPTGSHDQFSAENPPNQTTSYTGQISSAASAVAGRALSAKNVVATKLGYGGNTDLYGDEVNARPGSTTEPEQPQGKKGIAATVTEKLTPVYSTVAGAGSTVISKVGGGTAGSKDVNETAGSKDLNESKTTGQEKGVKGYLSEKLKPGEEDKALSEVITETLHKKKTAEPPVAKVTESAEVTRELGPDQGEEKVAQTSYGKVVADTLKGAVGSLFGKSGQSSPASSPQSRGSTTGTEGFPSSGSGVAEQQSRGGVEQQKIEGN